LDMVALLHYYFVVTQQILNKHKLIQTT
jgi:hypothetical protein